MVKFKLNAKNITPLYNYSFVKILYGILNLSKSKDICKIMEKKFTLLRESGTRN